jgi:hypothetical protein
MDELPDERFRRSCPDAATDAGEIDAANHSIEVPPPPPGVDRTPPPDHEEFLLYRNVGLRAMREDLERRRKRPSS